jgi:hypothetical protein
VSRSLPGRFFSGKETRYVTVHEVGWSPGPVWTSAEKFALRGFDPGTFQPEARRYSGYAIPSLYYYYYYYYYVLLGTLFPLCVLLQH